MAAPTRVQSNAGAVITATSGVISITGCTAGNLLIFQILKDGTAASLVPDTLTNVEDLNGGTTALTQLGSPTNAIPVGNPTAASGSLYLGRVIADGTCSVNTRSTGGDDLYTQIHEFQDVDTGTLLADVIENGTAGTAVDTANTNTTVLATTVETLGVDRLALNCGFINDDNAPANFTGESGGDWTLTASFGSATGTDGEVFLQEAPMATAGTISGGSFTMASDAWGVRGFALIGTTVAAPFIQLRDPWPALQAVNRSNVY